MNLFNLESNFEPKGDQPKAIKFLSQNILKETKHNVLLGVTGSGKTFTMANIIFKTQKPALIIAPNKTLAAQLYQEFKLLFPQNCVEYFVSYYDYYQPEAYIPSTDTYIEKDSSINDMIDKLRHSATMSVLSRKDIIIVASVSCIYGLGAPEDYLSMRVSIELNSEISRNDLLRCFVEMQYTRNDTDFYRGTFRVRGDCVEIFPSYEENKAIRIEFFGDEIDKISQIDSLKGSIIKQLQKIIIFPASHYAIKRAILERAIKSIKIELKEQIKHFESQNSLIEAQRIEQRTNFDLESMLELNYCRGIENYSRHITNRNPGEPPPTLLDYFITQTNGFITFIDESHITMPQIQGMYNGDRARKEMLVNYGFRLPSALDNRPLKLDEFFVKTKEIIYVSATPRDFELSMAQENITEQIVRPTGLLDPKIEIRPAQSQENQQNQQNQIDNLYQEIQNTIKNNGKILVTTLTKRMAEDIVEYYCDLGIKARYLHSDIKTLERIEIINSLRNNKFDVLIGINLLREGLDIPEVSLVAILDADKEGFLRSEKSLIQTFGRCARNINGRVIMYANTITKSMEKAIKESSRRRKLQESYNIKHSITPKSIQKDTMSVFDSIYSNYSNYFDKKNKKSQNLISLESLNNLDLEIKKLEKAMKQAAKQLDFEKAVVIRDKINKLKKMQIFE